MASDSPEEADIVLQRHPSPEDYYELRKLAHLTPPPIEAVPQALVGSWVSFVAFLRADMVDEKTPSPAQRAVAMGRLIGDGALFLQIVDMAVHPDHQRKGLGKRIMNKLIGYVDDHAPHAYVSLVADPPGRRLYPQFGFEDVKPSLGMYRCLRMQKDTNPKMTLAD